MYFRLYYHIYCVFLWWMLTFLTLRQNVQVYCRIYCYISSSFFRYISSNYFVHISVKLFMSQCQVENVVVRIQRFRCSNTMTSGKWLKRQFNKFSILFFISAQFNFLYIIPFFCYSIPKAHILSWYTICVQTITLHYFKLFIW